MRARILVSCLVVAAVATSAALAAPPPRKSTPTATTGCKPTVSVILTGTLAANGAAAPSTLSLKVTGGNQFARAYKKATRPISINVTTSTTISRQGDHNPANLKSGDRAVIQANTCKTTLTHDATPTLTATRITAHPTS